MRPKVNLLVIDFDNDFMGEDDGSPLKEQDAVAKLPVPNAISDAGRLARAIDRSGASILKIVKSLESHSMSHANHPLIWRGDDGKRPPEHTDISLEDYLQGKWSVRRKWMDRPALNYLSKLEKKERKLHIWPVHCPTGGWGQTVYWEVKDALNRWEARTFRSVNYKYKGMNPWTDQNGVFEAAVPDPNDPTTWFNHKLLNYIMTGADIVAVAGQTTPICVAETLYQMVSELDDKECKKIHLMTDCMSSIPAVPGGPDFPQISKDFLAEMESLDMTLTTSVELFG